MAPDPAHRFFSRFVFIPSSRVDQLLTQRLKHTVRGKGTIDIVNPWTNSSDWLGEIG